MGKKRMLLPALLLAAALAAGCGSDRPEPSSTPSGPEPSGFTADDVLFAEAEAALSRTPSLPDLQAAPLDVEADSLYEALSGEAADTLTQQTDETPLSTTVCLYRGQAPWYDPYFMLETVKTPGAPRTSVYYYVQRYPYLYTVFNPAEDTASLSGDALPFAAPEAAAAELAERLEAYGVELDAIDCRSLTVQALQALWDTRSAAGTLRENRWGDPGSQTKNHAATAEQAQWSEADACYYLTARQAVQGVPVEGTELSAYVGQEGLVNLSFSFIKLTQSGKPEPLADYPAVLRALSEAAQGIYAPEGCTLTELALRYCPAGGVYAPQWLAVFSYAYTDPDGNAEVRESEVRLDAWTGKEISPEAVE